MAGSEPDQVRGMRRVENEAIWRHTRVLFLVAGLFFLINIAIGFDNALTTGSLPHWQMLTHLHAGALGWITLTVIALAIWLFTGARPVTETYVRNVRLLGWLSIFAFAAYVASFAIAFSQGGDALLLLPVFGTGAMGMIWIVAIYAISQIRHQPVVTNPHLFLVGGLLVAGLGATVGVLVGLNKAFDIGNATVDAHAPTMLFYLFLVASAIVDWVVLGDSAGRWTRLGLLQAAVLVIAATIPPLAFLGGLEMLAPLILVSLVLFLLVFLARVGRRALYTNPFQTGVEAWTFFGALWLVIVVVLFPTELVVQPPPEWLLPVLAHMAFVGMTTNLLFGVISVRTRDAPRLHSWAEPTAMWLLNLGLGVFFALKIIVDMRVGALVMGTGVLLGVIVVLYRLQATPTDTSRGG